MVSFKVFVTKVSCGVDSVFAVVVNTVSSVFVVVGRTVV